MSKTFENRRSGQDRRREVTYGTGQPLSEAEIIRANKIHACPLCKIIHIGRDCKTQEQQSNDAYFRRVGAPEY